MYWPPLQIVLSSDRIELGCNDGDAASVSPRKLITISRSSRASRSPRAATSSSTPTSWPRSCRLATKTIDLEEFVDLDQIDPIYFEKPATTSPRTSTRSPTPCSPGRWSRPGKVAIARFVMRNRQYTAAIRADEQPPRAVHAGLRRRGRPRRRGRGARRPRRRRRRRTAR